MRMRVNQTSNGHVSRYEVIWEKTLTKASCTAAVKAWENSSILVMA